MNVAMSVDKSEICHDWLDVGSVPTPESIFASNSTLGTYSVCSDATNAVSLDGVNRNRPFVACQGRGTQTGAESPRSLGQKQAHPPPCTHTDGPSGYLGHRGTLALGGVWNP